MRKAFLSLLLLATLSLNVLAQGSQEYGSGLKLNLNPDGTKYVRFIIWSQIWARATELNPGSEVGGEALKTNYDIGARRLRMLAYAQVSKRYMVLAHFGVNNQTFINGGASGTSGTGAYGAGKKPQLFFHDFWNEYALIDPKPNMNLSIGAGLNYFMGLSRLTQASTLNFLTVDSPIFSWATIEQSDQFARQFGIFAKGKLNRLEYRFALNKPFSTRTPVVSEVAVDHNGKSKFSQTAYLEYHFLDIESNTLPYKVGSYLGTKRVFNVGAGLYRQSDATRSLKNSQELKHDINLFAVDAFLDMPIGKTALTAYTGFFDYNMGPNYLRNLGIMNPAVNNENYNGKDRFMAGAGNAQAMIGTGEIFYMQAGLLLPKKNKLGVQPYCAFTSKNFEALPEKVENYDFGVNWLLDGHHAKITTQYSLRSGIESASFQKRHLGEFILQFQVYL